MFRRSRASTNSASNTNGSQRARPTSLALSSHDGSPEGNTISTTDYARKCRELMQLYRALLELGANFILDVPRVVVIGGQSSGKSSLVEAVSGINVPRDSGTCTRCPMICDMSSDASSWSCTVKICREFDLNGQRLAEAIIEPFGPVIENKSVVELWIRRAQAAILSPHRQPSHFVTMSETELRNNARADPDILLFSKNSVHILVRDPSTTDLSFVDLPGLIQNADEEMIDTVRTLVESYITGQNTLIVIAMPMTDDIEMIQAMVLARNADPEKDRTIGVLTKPDTLTKGATGGLERWKSVLEGREHVSRLGYYCVRLLNDDERTRKMSASEAQRAAKSFFDSTPPWSQMQDRGRFGIPNFVTNVSALLVKLIEKNLPLLRRAVEEELRKCLQDIIDLPQLSDVEPATEVMLRINAFCRDIVAAVRGQKYEYFTQRNRARYMRFKQDISNTTPDFRPFELVDHYRSLPLVSTRTEARGLPYIRDAIGKSITWEFPGQVPFAATKKLVSEYTGLWLAPSSACFDEALGNLDAFVKELITLHFGQYEALEKYISALVFEQSRRCGNESRIVLDKILSLETDPFFTQNFESFGTEESKWLATYKQAHVWDTNSHPPSFTLQYTTNTQSNVVIETPRTWSLDNELMVMASVQAYFQVSYKRVIDSVPLTIEHELNQSFSSGIETTLLNKIFKDTDGGSLDLHDLLKEDPILTKRRVSLGKREARLRQIKDKLDNIHETAAS